jgi:hypothetical protein
MKMFQEALEKPKVKLYLIPEDSDFEDLEDMSDDETDIWGETGYQGIRPMVEVEKNQEDYLYLERYTQVSPFHPVLWEMTPSERATLRVIIVGTVVMCFCVVCLMCQDLSEYNNTTQL